MRILAMSGSLRASSTNTRLVRATAALAPENMEITNYDGLADLPHFSPDLDGDDPPASFLPRLFPWIVEQCPVTNRGIVEFECGHRFLLVSRADWSIRQPVRLPRPTGEPVERDVVEHLIPRERPLGELPAFRGVVGKLIVGEDSPGTMSDRI